MAKRRAQVSPFRDPKTGRWHLSALPATEKTYLGGLTFPALTMRPHMGPFNRVTDSKISDADEVYRQHDIGYGRLSKAGYNPYLRWNRYDEDLMRSQSTGWSDYLAKGVFGLKRLFTYGLPYASTPRFKSVYSQPEASVLPDVSAEKEYFDYKQRTQDAPDLTQYASRDFGTGAGTQAAAWARKGGVSNVDTSTSIPGGGGKFRTRVRYETF